MALLLVLVMTLCVVVPVSAAPAVPAKNTGVRHEVCTELSTQAQAYYTDAYTWDALSNLSGTPTESSLEAMQSELYTALHTLMADTQTDSATYRTLHDYWTYTDTQPGYTNATLFYGDVDGGLHDYNNHSAVNREHVWPKSHGSFVEENAGCDLHHLRPANAGLNSTRNNYVMANVLAENPNCSTKDFDGKTVLWYDSDARRVEVADNVKGDVARILLYVYTRWGQPNLCVNVPADQLPTNDSGSSNDGIRVMDNLDTLLSWCAIDPVDAWEMGRNDRVQDVQGNRNVFIDYPELAWLMFGQDVPAGMDTPSGNAANSGTTYTVTAASNNDAWGTVEAQGTRVVCTPAEGYSLDHVELTPADAAEVIVNGNIVKLNNITADVAVTVYFAPKTAASISYLLPEGAVAENAAVNGFVGDPIVLPAVTGDITVDGVDYRFEGWVRSTVADTTDLGETVVCEAGDTYVVESAKEVFIGLYSYTVAAPEGEGEATSFNKVTVAPADWSGEYVMAGTKNDGSLTLLLADGTNVGANTGSVALDAANVSLDGDTLNGVTANYVVVVAKQDDGTYTMQLKGAADPTYLAFYGTSNKLYTKNDPADPASRWTIELTENGVDVVSANPANDVPRYLRYNVSANMFRCYKGGQAYVSLYAAGAPSVAHYLTMTGEQPQLVINTHPADQTVLEGETAQFTVDASGTGLHYQWQLCYLGSSTWLNAPASFEGAQSAAVSVPAVVARNGYRFRCVVTDDAGHTVTSDEAVLTVTTPNAPLAVKSLTASKTSVVSGEKITISAEGIGGSGSYTYKFIVNDTRNDTWYKLQDFSANNTITWTATNAGTKRIMVDIKDSEGNMVGQNIPIDVVEGADEPLTVHLMASKETAAPDEQLSFTAVATGGAGGYTYKFIINDTTDNKWYRLQDYSENNVITWTATTPGTKRIMVDVKDANGETVGHNVAVVVG